ncbi:hypothetical protein HK405_009744 [Cladochytrium tenue]|nr:hypothetical protein HK405_009744 [Cladochytrium tenue]
MPTPTEEQLHQQQQQRTETPEPSSAPTDYARSTLRPPSPPPTPEMEALGGATVSTDDLRRSPLGTRGFARPRAPGASSARKARGTPPKTEAETATGERRQSGGGDDNGGVAAELEQQRRLVRALEERLAETSQERQRADEEVQGARKRIQALTQALQAHAAAEHARAADAVAQADAGTAGLRRHVARLERRNRELEARAAAAQAAADAALDDVRAARRREAMLATQAGEWRAKAADAEAMAENATSGLESERKSRLGAQRSSEALEHRVRELSELLLRASPEILDSSSEVYPSPRPSDSAFLAAATARRPASSSSVSGISSIGGDSGGEVQARLREQERLLAHQQEMIHQLRQQIDDLVAANGTLAEEVAARDALSAAATTYGVASLAESLKGRLELVIAPAASRRRGGSPATGSPPGTPRTPTSSPRSPAAAAAARWTPRTVSLKAAAAVAAVAVAAATAATTAPSPGLHPQSPAMVALSAAAAAATPMTAPRRMVGPRELPPRTSSAAELVKYLEAAALAEAAAGRGAEGSNDDDMFAKGFGAGDAEFLAPLAAPSEAAAAAAGGPRPRSWFGDAYSFYYWVFAGGRSGGAGAAAAAAAGPRDSGAHAALADTLRMDASAA